MEIHIVICFMALLNEVWDFFLWFIARLKFPPVKSTLFKAVFAYLML